MEILNLEEGMIDERIVRAVKEMGFKQFSPIQEQAIPEVLAGKDVIGQAQTGTGKTAAFGIPILQMIDVNEEGLQALVLCPTRELAIQAADELRKFAKYMSGIRVLPVYGGQEIYKQIKALKGNVQIIVGTPGRVMDHMRRHTIKLGKIKTVVLDEADEMLNMGFREDMEEILSQITHEHQTVLFSATMPKAILNITGQFQKSPILIKTIKKELTVNAIKQYYYQVKREDKEEAAARLLDYYMPKRTLIFCNTKKMVEELAEALKKRGYFAEGLHGDLTQNVRDRVMDSFKNGTTQILIATDVAARGIDVDDVEAVINFDVPQDIEYYVHRIGRTGRAGRSGRSFTLVVGREIFKIYDIEKICKTQMKCRTIPTMADIDRIKSDFVMKDIVQVMNDKNLKEATRVIERVMEEEDCTALEIAAAFLKTYLGEEREDIVEEKYISPKKKKTREDSWGTGKRKNGFQKEGFKNRDGKFFQHKDGKKDSRKYDKNVGEKKFYSKKNDAVKDRRKDGSGFNKKKNGKKCLVSGIIRKK